MIELHCHSYYSDGVLSPASLIEKAQAASVRLLSLTDHDTVAGLAELHEAAKQSTVQIIDGIELSVRWKMHDIHVLGFNIDSGHPLLIACIQAQEERRTQRGKAIGERLSQLGVVDDAYEKARMYAGHQRVGRPHYAHILVTEGVVRDTQTAFKRFLARGKPAYVPTEWLGIADGVDVIQKTGGVATLAHPHKYKLTRTKLNALISAFKEAGGVGMEVVSGAMTAVQIAEMAGLCQRFELLASSGSDYHGDMISRMGLGRQPPLPAGCIPIWGKWINSLEGL